MADSSSDRHSQLTSEFITKVAGNTRSQSEMMVVVESMILGAMLISTRAHGLRPAASVEMIETAVQRATERFAEVNGATGNG